MEDNFNIQFKVEGWKYKSIPKMNEKLVVELFRIVGKDNIKIISGSSGNIKLVENEDGTYSSTECEEWFRGDVLISPDGMANIKAYNEKVKNGKETEEP